MTDAKHSFIDVKQLDSLKAMLSYAFKTLMPFWPFKNSGRVDVLKKLFHIMAQVWLLLPLIAWGYKYFT